MDTLRTTINGVIVTIPSHEIPELIKTLVNHLTYHPPSEDDQVCVDYMTHDDCMTILSGKYEDRLLRLHVGNLWGGMCRLTKRRALIFTTQCEICRGPIEQPATHLGRQCPHVPAIHGYKKVRISRGSIISNHEMFMRAEYRQIGPAIKSDYQFLIDALLK